MSEDTRGPEGAMACNMSPQAPPETPMEPAEAARFLFGLLDDIDTFDDVARENNTLYRNLVRRTHARRWETGITSDGYDLTIPDARGPDAVGGRDYPDTITDSAATPEYLRFDTKPAAPLFTREDVELVKEHVASVRAFISDPALLEEAADFLAAILDLGER